MAWCNYYCSVIGRNPCTSKDEALDCNNAFSNRGGLLEFKARDVADWIRWNTSDEDLLSAADLIEKNM